MGSGGYHFVSSAHRISGFRLSANFKKKLFENIISSSVIYKQKVLKKDFCTPFKYLTLTKKLSKVSLNQLTNRSDVYVIERGRPYLFSKSNNLFYSLNSENGKVTVQIYQPELFNFASFVFFFIVLESAQIALYNTTAFHPHIHWHLEVGGGGLRGLKPPPIKF